MIYEREGNLGRYLDMAKALKGHSSPGLGYEINELNEKSPLRAPSQGYEINELNEKSPQGETWDAAAASTKIVRGVNSNVLIKNGLMLLPQ